MSAFGHHPDAELTVVRKWASSVRHLAWVGGAEHSVDFATVFGRQMVAAHPPIVTLCEAVLKGRWPGRIAGDLVICIDEPGIGSNCRHCLRAAKHL